MNVEEVNEKALASLENENKVQAEVMGEEKAENPADGESQAAKKNKKKKSILPALRISY